MPENVRKLEEIQESFGNFKELGKYFEKSRKFFKKLSFTNILIKILQKIARILKQVQKLKLFSMSFQALHIECLKIVKNLGNKRLVAIKL